MKNTLVILLFIFSISFGYSQTVDSTQTTVQPKSKEQVRPVKKSKSKVNIKKVFFGGSFGLSFGNYTSVRIYPMIGYKITPKLSIGTKLMYEYAKNTTFTHNNTYNNYGLSVFSRYRIIPQIYVHAEYNYMNYEKYNSNNEDYRYAVPYLFLGGGFVQRTGRNSHIYAEILFDVLNDANSPYADWTPFYSVGVSVGF